MLAILRDFPAMHGANGLAWTNPPNRATTPQTSPQVLRRSLRRNKKPNINNFSLLNIPLSQPFCEIVASRPNGRAHDMLASLSTPTLFLSVRAGAAVARRQKRRPRYAWHDPHTTRARAVMRGLRRPVGSGQPLYRRRRVGDFRCLFDSQS